MNFQDLKLTLPLLNALKDVGYTNPTEIQNKAIPLVLNGKDIIGCAQTGTGKTAAFALPILQLLQTKSASGKAGIRSLILAPTRELAIQIDENFKIYGKQLPLRH